MKRVISIVIVTALAIVTSADALMACGDKFFVPGRGAKFVPSPSERAKATVLFYAPAGSALSKTLANLKADAALRKAGYKPTLATTPADLKSAANTTWDIVLVGTDDGGVAKDGISASSKAHVVAVLPEGTGAQLAAARKSYPVVVRDLKRNQDILDVLDEAASRAFDEYVKSLKAPKGH